MEPSLKDLSYQIDEATGLLLGTAGRLTDPELRQPSLLPGWSRGHVLNHVARSGDALRRLLDGARTGVPGVTCSSPEAREADIASGADRGAEELVADLRESAAAWRAAVAAMPDAAWTTTVTLAGRPAPARQLLIHRLVELELHHVDLDAGYHSVDWPTTFNELQLTEPLRGWRADRLA